MKNHFPAPEDRCVDCDEFIPKPLSLSFYGVASHALKMSHCADRVTGSQDFDTW